MRPAVEVECRTSQKSAEFHLERSRGAQVQPFDREQHSSWKPASQLEVSYERVQLEQLEETFDLFVFVDSEKCDDSRGVLFLSHSELDNKEYECD